MKKDTRNKTLGNVLIIVMSIIFIIYAFIRQAEVERMKDTIPNMVKSELELQLK